MFYRDGLHRKCYHYFEMIYHYQQQFFSCQVKETFCGWKTSSNINHHVVSVVADYMSLVIPYEITKSVYNQIRLCFEYVLDLNFIVKDYSKTK